MYSLSAWDYLIVLVMLIASAAIGVFFAFRSGRKQSSSEYFLGERHMSVVPVAASLAATYVSAITYLGTPAEVYINGPYYGLMATLRTFVPAIIVYCFIPVFYRLKITTVYEYLELRFNNTVRYLVIASEFVSGFTFMGIVLYAPSLALSTVTGLNLTFSIIATGIICTFYTSIGGMRAVIWTDVFQATMMVIGAIIMIIVGNVKIGGPSEGWRRAAEGGRTQLIDFNIDPTVRLTFWTVLIGGTSYLTMIMGTKQSLVQRYLCCRSERDAQKAAWVGMIGTSFIELLAVTTGMTVFAYYYACDPLTANNIQRPDQIVPYFIVDVFHTSPGVPGLLISAVLCASLSSMSSALNAMAAVTGQDIVKTIWPNMADNKFAMVVKGISILFGLLTIAMAFLASVLGDVLQTALTIFGLTGGPILGVFLLGLLVPRANAKGASFGMIGGTLVGLGFYIGSQFFPPVSNRPPLSVEGCAAMVNETTSIIDATMYTDTIPTSDSFISATNIDSTIPARPPGSGIFSLSYLYMTTITALTCIVVGLVVSVVTSRKNPQVTNPELLAPVAARFFTNLDTGRKGNGHFHSKGVQMCDIKREF